MVNGLRVNYLEAGSGSKVLLLIHGGVNNDAFSTWSKWNNTIEALSKNYKVFAPDLPGYGASERPKDCTHEYYVNFIKNFVDGVIGSKVNLVGTSMGAGVALGYVLENQDSVDSVVLVAPSCLGFTMDRKSRLGILIPNTLAGSIVGFLAGHERLTRRILGILRDDEKEEMVAKAVKLLGECPMRPAFSEYMRSEAATLKGFLRGRKEGLRTNYSNKMPSLSGSKIRLLFVEGDGDVLVNKDEIRMATSNVAEAQVVVMDGCRHSPHFQEPEKFNAVVNSFIAGQAVGEKAN